MPTSSITAVRTARTASIASALALLLVLVLAAVASASTLTGDPAPSIASDYADYGPGDLVTLTGSNWVPGETVHVSVNDDTGATWSRDVDVTADAYGSVRDQFNLPNWFVASYSVKATDAAGSVATTGFTDSVQGLASVDVSASYRNTTGNRYSFTLKNTSTGGETVRSFRIAAPDNAYTVTNCAAPAGWAVDSTSSTACTFESGSLAVNATASGFTVTASIGDGDNDSGKPWGVDKMSTSGTYDNSGQAKAGAATAGSLDETAYVFEVKDVLLATANPAIDSACPGSSRSAPAGSTRVVVVCGINHRATALTTGGTNVSLGGAELASTGTFTGGSVGASSSASKVLGYWAGAKITSTVGTNNDATARISTSNAPGGTFNQTSPNTGFTGYDATNPISTTSTSVARQAGTNPSTYGDSVTFRATVSGNSGNPASAGTVTFKDGSAVLCDSVALTSNTADCATTSLGAGAHSVTAEYSGATGFTSSTSTPLPQTVNQRALTVTADDKGKTYGDDDPSLSYTVTSGSLVSGDSFSGSITRDAGETVGASPYAIRQGTLSAGSNYTVSFTNGRFTITAKRLTGSFTANDKVYDGTRAAAVTGASLGAGVVGNDDVGIDRGSATATFDTKDVGAGKTVTGQDFTLTGADAGDYALSMNTTTAAITRMGVTGDFTAADKTYDGNTSAAITGSSLEPGVVAGDAVTLVRTNATADFGSKDVGQGKTVSGHGFVLTGADSGNYALSMNTASANITPKGLTGDFTAMDKVYDAGTSATITGSSLELGGIAGNDDVTLDGSKAKAAFADKNVGPDKTVTATGFALIGTSAGNYTLSMNAATASITAKDVAGSFSSADKVYDGTTAATVGGRSLSGTISGDTVSLTGGSADFADKNVGTGKTVTGAGFTLGGTDAGNYDLTSVASTTASITPKSLTACFTAAGKVYDATTAATITGSSLKGVVGTEDVTLSGGSATFDTKDAGAGKIVTAAGFTLDGADKGNYALGLVLTAKADVTAKDVSGGFTAADKVYDGTPDASITGRSLTGKVADDDVALGGGSATFADKDAGDGKDVTGTGFTLTGADAGNYHLTASTLTAKASISKKAIAGSFTADDKVYDGNATAHITTSSLGTGTVAGDDLALDTANAGATFADKNVGNGKTVTSSGFGLTGADRDDYALTMRTARADITAKSLTASFTAADKGYDATTAATITGRSLDGAVGNDDVSLTGGSASFDTKDVGTGKLVTATGFSLSGDDSGNYAIGLTDTATAAITAKDVTGSFTAADKGYDGTTDATITGRSVSGKITGDELSLTGGSASFADKNAGEGKTVTGNGFGLSGADAGNYHLTSSTLTTKASIARKAIGGSFTAADKVYDGNTTASILTSALGSGTVGGDDVALDAANAGATFADENVGNGKVVTSSGFGLTGADRDDYALTMDTARANVTPKSITGSFTAANKVYDGSASASVLTRSLSGVVSGDAVSHTGGSAAFDDKKAGQAKTVTLTGSSLSGADASNYTLASVGTAKADITPKTVTGSFTAANKVYDGTTAATITGTSLTGALNGDTVTLSGGTATFADPNVGTRTVTGTGFGLSGADSGNYSLASSTLTTTASITYAPSTASCLGSPGHTILQPINADGTSVFKQGSTVPAKFRVCDANGNSIGTAGVVSSFKLVKTISGTDSSLVNETVDSSTPDSAFRWSATDQQWIFNITTKTLKAGQTYGYQVVLNDGTPIQFQFGLK